MYTTRDVYGNPRFIIHFLDLVHEDHPGDHVDKMESARRMANKHGGRRYRGRVFGGGFVFQVYGLDLLIDELYNDIYKRIAKYETNDGHLFDTREEAAFLTRFLTRGGARSGTGSSTTSRHSKN